MRRHWNMSFFSLALAGLAVLGVYSRAQAQAVGKDDLPPAPHAKQIHLRSEERRVGKECVP